MSRRPRAVTRIVLRIVLAIELTVVVGIGAYSAKTVLGIDLIPYHHAWELFE